jgi:galactonate dehydratase
MKITNIKTYMARYGQRTRGHIKVETDEGIHGWGEAYSVGPDLSVKPIADYILEMIKGEDPRQIDYIMMKLQQQFRFPPGGVGLAVVSAVDHALWDISGKAAGLPVYMLLGGKVRDRVRIYVSPGGSTVEDTVAQTSAINEQWGVTAFKLSPYRIGMDDNRWGRICDEAARFFSELRSRTPENWDFAFDPHAKIFEPIRAVQLANALAPYDPLFYEEPLRPEHIPAWSRIRSQMKPPLATGESLYTKFEFLDLIASGGADIVQPDVCVCGGLLEMRKIAIIAEAHYITVAPHNPMGPLATAVNVHFAAASHNFTILEYISPLESEMKDWADDPYLPTDGYLTVRDRPGLGIDINEDVVSRGEYVHWQRTSPARADGSTGYI